MRHRGALVLACLVGLVVRLDGLTTVPAEVTEVHQVTTNGDTIAYVCSISRTGALVRTATTSQVYVMVGDEKRGPFDDLCSFYVDRRMIALAWSGRGRNLLYVPRVGDAWYVHEGDTRHGPFDEVDALGVALWPGLATAVFQARTADSWYIHAAGDRYGPYQALHSQMIWVPNENTFAYQARNGGQWGIYLGGKLLRTSKTAGSMYWAVVNGTLAYELSEGGRSYVVSGGERLGPFQTLHGMSASPDGSVLSCTFKHGGRWYALVGGQTLGPYDEPPYVFWVGPSEYACKARTGGQEFLVGRGTTWGPYGDIWHVAFAPDAGPPAFTERVPIEIGWEWYLHVGDDRLGPFPEAPVFAWSPDGARLAYTSKERDGGTHLIAGSERYGPWDAVKSLTWSPDGRTLACVARQAFRDHVFQGPVGCGPIDGPEDLFWSPDGKALAFSFRRGDSSFSRSALMLHDGCYIGFVGAGKILVVDGAKIEAR